MRVWLHEAAEEELDAAATDCKSSRSGVGIHLAGEVYASIALACAYPQAGLSVTDNTSRRLLKRFPFAIAHQPKGGDLYSIAIGNLRRAPGYWRKRLP